MSTQTSKIDINFIGCGRVGKTLAKLFIKSKVAKIVGVVTSSLASAARTCKWIGEGQAFSSLQNLPSAKIYFITTKDSDIENMCVQLNRIKLPAGAIVVHCSGMLSSSILKTIKQKNIYRASIHPLKSFSDPSEVRFNNTFCAFEGDAKAYRVINKLFAAIGGTVFKISAKEKTNYHLASVIANNFTTILHELATSYFEKSNIPKSIAKQMVSTLMQDVINNVAHLPHEKVLTGPLQRGDVAVLKAHLQKIKNPKHKKLYALFSYLGLDLTTHPVKKKKKIKTILSKAS